MQMKRFASAVALAGMIAVGSGAAAHAVNYPPSLVFPERPAGPEKPVTEDANRPATQEKAQGSGPVAVEDQLAYTGSDALIGVAAGALLILGGAGAVVASRRRTNN